MKVIYAKRTVSSNFHIHASSFAEIFYVPEFECAFGFEIQGSFGKQECFFTEADFILKEAKDLDVGVIPNDNNVIIEEVEYLDLDSTFVLDLINKLKDMIKLKEAVTLQIDDLINHNTKG